MADWSGGLNMKPKNKQGQPGAGRQHCKDQGAQRETVEDRLRENPTKRLEHKGPVPFRRLLERSGLSRTRETAAAWYLESLGIEILEGPRRQVAIARNAAQTALEFLESLADYHRTPDDCVEVELQRNPEEDVGDDDEEDDRD